MGLIEDLGEVPAVAVDTAPFIYFIEEHPRFLPIVAPLFRAADQGHLEIVSSVLTLFEVLVVPYRAGNRILAEQYEALLTHSRGIRLIDVTRDQLRAAAQLRAATNVSTPDALQLVAALASRCPIFVTNDRRLPSIPGLRLVQLSSYLV